MAEYKVVFRDENPEWQENCPVLIEAVQVSRDVQSSAAFLQLRVRNISDKTIGSVFVEAKVVSPDGGAETVSVESLDADIAPNAEYRPSAVQLSNSEIATVKAYVTRIDGCRDFGEAIPVPTPQPIAMSQDALDERKQQLAEMGFANASLGYRHQDGNGWWICSCGALNISNQKCRMCGIKKDSLANLENEALLEEQCAERKYLDASAGLVSNNVTAVEKARTTFAGLGDYKDSTDLVGQCDDKIKALKKGRSKKAKISVVACIVAAVVIAVIVLAVTVLIPSAKVNEAMQKAENGDYDEAIAMLKEYDETEKIADVNRMKAAAFAEEGRYDEAVRLYKDLGDGDAVKEVQKQWADKLFSDGAYDDALSHYQEASSDEGVFECASKFAESGEYAKAINVLEPLASKGYTGAEEAVDEAKYGYITANYNNTDETTCKYLLELKAKGYKDTQELCNALYTLSASSLGFENKPIRKYNNVTFKYEITGCMPGGLDDRTVSVYDSIHNESKQKQLKYGGSGSLLMSQLIDGGAHSATITITDDATGSVLLDETISF